MLLGGLQLVVFVVKLLQFWDFAEMSLFVVVVVPLSFQLASDLVLNVSYSAYKHASRVSMDFR